MTNPLPPEQRPLHSLRETLSANQPPPELFTQPPVRSEFARRRGLSYAARRIITVLVLALIACGVFYWFYGRPMRPVAPGEIPTLKAEGPYKQKPENPGGIDIPNQDMQVYHEIDNDAPPPKPETEHLLPPPESPQAPPAAMPAQAAMPAPNATPIPEPPKLESLMSEPVTAPAPASAPAVASPAPPALASAPLAPKPIATTVTPPPAAMKPAETQPAATKPAATARPAQMAQAEPAPAAPPAAPVATVAAKPAPHAAKAAKAAPAGKTAGKTAAKTVTGGAERAVQVASIPNEADAREAMKRLEAKYAAILGAVPLHLVRADLGAKGIYYRIQSPPLAKDRAGTICAAIKNLKAGCILVSP